MCVCVFFFFTLFYFICDIFSCHCSGRLGLYLLADTHFKCCLGNYCVVADTEKISWLIPIAHICVRLLAVLCKRFELNLFRVLKILLSSVDFILRNNLFFVDLMKCPNMVTL